MKAECLNPECDYKYQFSIEQFGKKIRCKGCGELFVVGGLPASPRLMRCTQPNEDDTESTQYQPKSKQKKLGRFQIEKVLGSGAFGTVYRAFDSQLQRPVALKVPRSGSLRSKSDVERFLREARAAAQLTHPNIVPVFDAGRDGKQLYIASAFVDGSTMEQAVDDRLLEFRGVADIVRQLAEGLDYAHRLGVIHRDIKPANIMLDEYDQPHLMDFGLARFDGSQEKLTQDGTVMGTPAYMPPEQALGALDDISPASDQYSLGVTMYEALCGELPFSGSPEIVIYNVINEEPPRPRTLKPEIPRDLETICLKAMAKEQNSRYGSCREFADDLRRWLDDEPIQARKISRIERLRRWSKRRPLESGLIAGVVLVTLIGFIGISWQWGRAETNLAEADRQKTEAQRQKTEAQNNLKTANLRKEEAERAQAEEERQRKIAQWQTTHAEALARLADVRSTESRRNLDEAEAELYSSRLTRAALEDDPVLTALILNECPPSRRHWEWHHLMKQAHRKAYKRQKKGARDTPSATGWGPPGQFNPGMLVEIRPPADYSHDGEDGAITLPLPEFSTVTAVEFSDDGQSLAVAGVMPNTNKSTARVRRESPFLRLYSVATGEMSVDLPVGDDVVMSLQFIPEKANKIVTAGEKRLRIWNLETGQSEFTDDQLTAASSCMAVSPNGKFASTGHFDGSCVIWDLDQRGRRDLRKSKPQQRLTPPVQTEFSKNGEEVWFLHLMTQCYLSTWKTSDGEKVSSRRLGGANGASAQQLGCRIGNNRVLRAPLFDRDERLLTFAIPPLEEPMRIPIDEFDRPGVMYRDNTFKKSGVQPIDNLGNVGIRQFDAGPSLSRDRQRIVTAGDSIGSVIFWNVNTRSDLIELALHDQPIDFLRFSADGTRLAVVGKPGIVKIWHAEGHLTRNTSITKRRESEKSAEEVVSKPLKPAMINSIGMALSYIPDGEFLMGTPDTLQRMILASSGIFFNPEANERPQHLVRITRPFLMGTHEVTRAQFMSVLGKTGWPESRKGKSTESENTDNYPAAPVSWDDAVKFCQTLSARPEEQQAGRSYRLPTEAEWEYACRAGTSTIFSFGNDLTGQDANARISGGPSRNAPQEVGRYTPNALGLYDMHGNAAEWCSDWYHAAYYKSSPLNDPGGPTTKPAVDARARQMRQRMGRPGAMRTRVLRGGDFQVMVTECRSASRSYQRDPTFTGFRVVCELAENVMPRPSDDDPDRSK